MDSLRVKLTYGGPQDGINPSLGFRVHGTSIPVDWFVPYRRSGFDYGNDGRGLDEFAASRQELKNLLDLVGVVPGLTAGDVDPEGTVAFTLLSTAGGTTRVFEKITAEANGRELFGRILQVLASNVEGTIRVRSLGCRVDQLPTDPPVDVSNQVTIKFTGFRPDRTAKNHFVGRLQVTNQSASTLPTPLTVVVVRKRGNYSLLSKTGTTCNISPKGAPFVDIVVGLAPGMTTEANLRIANPNLAKADVEFKVFAGPGTR